MGEQKRDGVLRRGEEGMGRDGMGRKRERWVDSRKLYFVGVRDWNGKEHRSRAHLLL